jgi:serine/threonine protein phosphatase PrpC
LPINVLEVFSQGRNGDNGSSILRGGNMQAEVVTNVGLVRKNNEDAYKCDVEKGIFIVADGMGGCVAGEVASTLAVDTVYQVVSSKQDCPLLETLRESFYQANNRIYETGKNNSKYSGMGTTLTVAWIKDDTIYTAHVGDSRAYLIREGKITSLTEDHSLVGELMREGGLTEEEAMVHPQKNILTRALGCSPFVEVDVSSTKMLVGDYLLLCTDGMSNLITSAEIVEVIIKTKDIKKIVRKLVELALKRGGHDNITAILVSNN